LPVESDDDVPRLESGAVGWTPRGDGADQNTAHILQSEVGGDVGGDRLNLDANPATATGGVSIYLGGGIAAYPFFIPNLASEQGTANFGDTAFTGAVPSGFTSGFTAGAVIPTNELLTQGALEQWGSGTPDLWATQLAVEMWGNTQVVNPLMIATQLAVEMWAPVASAPPPTSVQARAMILA